MPTKQSCFKTANFLNCPVYYVCNAVAPKLKNLRRRSWGTKHLEGRSTLLSFFPRIVKVTKSQKISSIRSNPQINVQKHCPLTFLFKLRTWGIVISHILLRMGPNWKYLPILAAFMIVSVGFRPLTIDCSETKENL